VPEDSSAVDGEGERPENTEHGEDGTPETVVEHADVWIVSVAEGLEPCRAHLWPGRPPGRGGTACATPGGRAHADGRTVDRGRPRGVPAGDDSGPPWSMWAPSPADA